MEVLSILQNGESETVEFKEQFDRETIETAVAFSNTRGGVILVGVKNDGRVIGCSISGESLKDWCNRISQNTEPTIIPDVYTKKIKGKNIVVFQVTEYPLKPVATKGRCLRRVSNSNRQMSPQEIAQMHLISTGNSWDALPARDKTAEEIDPEKVKRYIKIATASGRKNFNLADDPHAILQKLELLKNGEPTWAAILLFGKSPQSPLTQAQVHCGRFKNDVIIIDDRLIEGSIIDQIDEVMDFVRKNINVKFVITGKPQRDEVWDYPLDALREAVINAICHRDYSDSADIQIKIFDDRFQIWNPGPLPFGMTIDELLNPTHSSKPRNKLIAQVFYDLTLIERYGSGIQRMINACVVAGLPEPTFEERFGGFIVTFRTDIYSEDYLHGLGLNERQIKAVLFAKREKEITNREYREMFNISDRMARIDLKDLCDKNIFLRSGEGKSPAAKYVLMNKK